MALDESQLRRFVRGELGSDEIARLEDELDRSPSLRGTLAAIAREAATTTEETASMPEPLAFSGAERIVLGPTIGEGGMASVRLGLQTSLGRTVAVKMIREYEGASEQRLLLEARLTARLQHPNIIPIHDVARGASNALQVVMKRVEGVRWSNLMRDTATLRTKYGADDPLDWNLGVLIALCHALAYAHDQGVLHRDVKPTNVMVGAFGEVYLLDWGIAAMWGEHRDPDIAHVEDAPIAGTSSYMAPEQLEGIPDALGPWTDVYLLGAVLYEVIQGTPPHAGQRESERRTSPRGRPTPPLGADVPRELADLVKQSLSAAPEDRPLSPEQFRLALESYRHHRGSVALVDSAEKKLAAARGEQPRFELDRLLTAAELGFRAALDGWPNNARAAAGLRAVVLDRVTLALTEENPQVAKEWLARIDDPPESVVARVEAACAADERTRAEGALAAWHRDPAVGVFMRRTLLTAFAPLWVLGWVGFAVWPVTSMMPILVYLGICILLGFAFVLSQGLAILKTQANRTNILGGAAAIGMCAAWGLACHRLGLEVFVGYLGFLMAIALTLWVVAFTLDKRALLPACWTLACLAGATLWPTAAPVAMASASIGVAASTVIHNHLLRAQRARLAREGLGVDSIGPKGKRARSTTPPT